MTRTCTLLTLVVVTTACGAGGDDAASVPVAHVLSAGALEELPTLAIEDGALLCTADGYDDCPLQTAVANRLDADRIAIWEPGRTIQLWTAADSLAVPLGHSGTAAGDYRTAVALRAKGRGFELVEAGEGSFALLTLDGEGRITGREAIPTIGPQSVLGFVGGTPVRQEYADWNTLGGGSLRVIRLDSPLDSTGTLLVSAAIPWMRGGSADIPPLPPLIAATPSWALTRDGGVVWSPGSPFIVEGRGPGGVVRWTLRGPDGPAVTGEDLDRREAELRAANLAFPLNDEDYAQMRSRSDSTFPEVGGVTTLPDGRVIVAGVNVPRDSAAVFYRLDTEGVPVARFTLDRRARILLAEGDSLLLHRPTEGEPWELRWVRLREP